MGNTSPEDQEISKWLGFWTLRAKGYLFVSESYSGRVYKYSYPFQYNIHLYSLYYRIYSDILSYQNQYECHTMKQMSI